MDSGLRELLEDGEMSSPAPFMGLVSTLEPDPQVGLRARNTPALWPQPSAQMDHHQRAQMPTPSVVCGSLASWSVVDTLTNPAWIYSRLEGEQGLGQRGTFPRTSFHTSAPVQASICCCLYINRPSVCPQVAPHASSGRSFQVLFQELEPTAQWVSESWGVFSELRIS